MDDKRKTTLWGWVCVLGKIFLEIFLFIISFFGH